MNSLGPFHVKINTHTKDPPLNIALQTTKNQNFYTQKKEENIRHRVHSPLGRATIVCLSLNIRLIMKFKSDSFEFLGFSLTNFNFSGKKKLYMFKHNFKFQKLDFYNFNFKIYDKKPKRPLMFTSVDSPLFLEDLGTCIRVCLS